MKWTFRIFLALLVGVALGVPGTAAVQPKTKRISVRASGAERSGGSYIWKRSISENGKIIAFETVADLVPQDDNGGDDIYARNVGTGEIERVSVKSNGDEANGQSDAAEISADGRLVSFESNSNDLVAHDENGAADVFVHNRETGNTRRVSVSSNGDEGSESSTQGSISPNGHFVAFQSHSPDLVINDGDNVTDVFVRNLVTGKTRRASVKSDGTLAVGDSSRPSVADDGTVAFTSFAGNLVDDDENTTQDVFIHRFSGGTERVSVASNGDEGAQSSHECAISRDGDAVAFISGNPNFVAGAGGDQEDMFVHRISTGKTRLASKRSNGDVAEGDSTSYQGALSYNGRYVVFSSTAENLVAGDDNEKADMFWHDMKTGKTKLVSVTHDGSELVEGVQEGSVSGDGRYVAFDSMADNFVPGDTNDSYDVFRRGPLF